ncbi:hypothetical protein [Streptomyces sp. KLOTTS4A1]|uniref:hypothetical protein n=1 Tax=Streptomyces sp. KLOTTS4A1 TaxID=3390996 RepID=UPI0039F4F353
MTFSLAEQLAELAGARTGRRRELHRVRGSLAGRANAVRIAAGFARQAAGHVRRNGIRAGVRRLRSA